MMREVLRQNSSAASLVRSFRLDPYVVLVPSLLVGALLFRIPWIGEPSIRQRETQSALLAREWYLGDGSGLPEWKQRVLRELPKTIKPIEPPVLDYLAAAEFRVDGENFAFPRLVSSVLWVLGGVFLYLIAIRLTSREGAIMALALYLTWPFAVSLSRHFMPDPLMVSLMLAAALSVIRYWEKRSPARLLAAGAVSSLATAAKPGVAFLFLFALFVSLAASHRALRATLLRGSLALYAGITASIAVVYYVAGTYIGDFIRSDADDARITPDLVVKPGSWEQLWHTVSYLLVYPSTRSLLALVPIALAMAGIIVAPRGTPRAVLVGLVLGYVAFVATFMGYTPRNPYYSLPLIPILALAIGVLFGQVVNRAGAGVGARRAAFALVAVVVAVAAAKSYPVLKAGDNRQAISDYRRIGELTEHTTRALVVNQELRTPVMYWGWIVGTNWEFPDTDPPPDPDQADFLVVVGRSQYENARQLKMFVRGRAIVSKTNRYAIFDLRR